MRIPAYSTLVLALLIAVVAVVFALQNDGEITVQFIRWQTTGSVATILLITFALGVASTTLALLPTLMRAVRSAALSRKEAKRFSRELVKEKQHEQELVEEVAKARGAAEQAMKDANTERKD